ncbi:MAG: hypothetical protein J6J35_03755 [Alphaproteobacteria bacterium]|nr:hypothetical protein [Alphaproteobacteria bacterium]
MPQLETSTYITQIFWLFTTFFCFWLVMAKVIIPKIAETVEARKRKYNDFILKADEFNKKALASLNRYEETLAAAKTKAAEQIALEEKALKDYISQKQEEINQQLNQKIQENEARLQEERAETMKDIEAMAESAACVILSKLDIDFPKNMVNKKITTKRK